MISQGLLHHPDVTASFSAPVQSLGKVHCPSSKSLFDDLLHADYIFRACDQFFQSVEIDEFLSTHKLWSKVVYYDQRDSSDIDSHRLETCAVYAKRSYLIGPDRKLPPKTDPPIWPLDFSLLDEYFAVPDVPERDIDVLYPFSTQLPMGARRRSVYEELRRIASAPPDKALSVRIGATALSFRGRRAILDLPERNPFIEYLKLLRRAKIIFTAYPEGWVGDSRTWEAFASGALVVLDSPGVPSPYLFVDHKHCILYNAASVPEIRRAISRAKHLLEDTRARRRIARTGLAYVRQHHNHVSRISWILEVLQQRGGKLCN